MDDTIAAIATSLGVGAISIIRVSGKDSIKIVNSLTKYKKLEKAESHTINYDFIVENNKIIDETLISVMRTPKTFTRENVVEINCHGGIATTQKILELLLINGCRLAEPGEFTKRAFLNGRIDLIEAEAIMDIINAKTDKARALSINQIQGNVSKIIKDLRNKILNILANIEVNIDYPEYEDAISVTKETISNEITYIEDKIKDIIAKSEDGKIIKNGITISLIGRPNVGKSSLLNCLLQENKAIVTDIEGTTRDCVEGQFLLDGIVVNIIDTAGIRKTDNIIESIGVNKSLEIIEKSDLVLILLNNNEELTSEDKNILLKIKDKNHIIVVNKNDLETKLDISNLDKTKIVYISVKNNEGIDKLKEKIKEIFNIEKIETEDLTYLTNANSIATVKKTLNNIASIKEGIKNDMPVDLLEIDLKEIWNLLGKVIGEIYEEELLDKLFSQFCLGK